MFLLVKSFGTIQIHHNLFSAFIEQKHNERTEYSASPQLLDRSCTTKVYDLLKYLTFHALFQKSS